VEEGIGRLVSHDIRNLENFERHSIFPGPDPITSLEAGECHRAGSGHALKRPTMTRASSLASIMRSLDLSLCGSLAMAPWRQAGFTDCFDKKLGIFPSGRKLRLGLSACVIPSLETCNRSPTILLAISLAKAAETASEHFLSRCCIMVCVLGDSSPSESHFLSATPF
jgi:hypothetical protein